MSRPALLLLAAVLAGPAAAEEPAPTPAPYAATPAPEVKPEEAKPAEPPHANAGFGNEAFFLRSDDDNFILVPGGRFQMDWFGYQGGAKQPFNSFTPKRARLEVSGTFLKHFDYQLGTELTGGAPTATDIYVNANFTPFANVQVGQFDAPFTLDNRTSDKWSDLQERSNAVRDLAIPENKEIGMMVWGQPEKKWAYWSLGIFNGEGQNQLPHRSNDFDVMGRAWIAPLALADMELLKNVWIGASYWDGFRSAAPSAQIDRISMKTQGGYTFFAPTYGTVHAGDYGQISKWGVELNAPVQQFVLKAEYVSSSEGTRELDLKTPSAPAWLRRGTLSGSAFYARLSYFVWGDPLLNGLGGMQNPAHLFGALKPGKTGDALQLVAQYDHVGFSYAANDGAAASVDKLVGDYAVDSVGLGVNYWYTKHVRMTGDFIYNAYSGPGPRPVVTADSSYEITLRLALAL